MQDEINPFIIELWRMAVDLDRAPAWRAWWEPAGIPRLELRPGAAPRAHSHLTHVGRRLQVDTTWPALWSIAKELDRQLRRKGTDTWPDEMPTAFWEATGDAVYGSLQIVDSALGLGGLPSRLQQPIAARPAVQREQDERTE
jgi:hypothetical protein